MFVLAAKIHRNGAFCREYYQPEAKGPLPGIVIASLLGDNKHEAKQYATEEEAIAEIPAFRHIAGYKDQEISVVPV